MKMNKWIWYSLVLFAVYLLIKGVWEENFLLSILALGLALILKTQYHNIPLPKTFEKHKIYSFANQKIYEKSESER